MTPIDLVVEEHFHRAAPGGMGGTKAAGNYSPVSLLPMSHPCAHPVSRYFQISFCLACKVDLNA